MEPESPGPELPNLLSCKCLNVKILEGSLHPIPAQRLATVPKEVLTLFDAEPGSVKVIMADEYQVGDSIQVKVQALLTQRYLKDWKLFTCFNCKTLIYAKNNDLMIIINSGALIGEKEQKSLELLNDYFAACELLMKPSDVSAEKASTLKQSVIDAIHVIKDKTSEYLSAEEEKAKERIAAFERQQMEALSELKQTSDAQRKQLEALVYAAYREESEDTDSAFERSIEELTSSHSPQGTRSGTRSDSLVDDDIELDPFNDGEEFPAGEMDDEDDELPNYRSRQERGAGYSDQLAKSVPVRIPGYSRPRSSIHVGSESSDEEATPDHDDMQASMRALAQSIGGDGTEMFGDLPRHRFNSYSYRPKH